MIVKKTDEPIDGRLERGERTRMRILRAARKIIDKNNRQPTVKEVATAAKVAVRTIYHHFGTGTNMTKHAITGGFDDYESRELVVTMLPFDAGKPKKAPVKR